MTCIADLFERDITRPIDGVIKADDRAGLMMELEEYVITNEISKRLSDFLEEYNNYSNKNGVWISGFFGSGKSHLLKMLSLALEGAKVDEVSAADLFSQKCADDKFLKAALDKACQIPSRSVLFNIDQKAAIISNNDVDKLLTVFQSVFNEVCGYYKEGYIAQLERELDAQGLYEAFKEEFERISANNLPWSKGREQALFESDIITNAFNEVSGQTSITNVLQHYQDNYKVSVEDFAKQVKAYIDRQAPGFRLNFFVDEVGQFVADNTRLMLNLQTIAESLNTICRGQAWIIVTAQEALDKVVGDMNAQQSNDFSRVQARFGIRMHLTSANVEEVIQKRLLKKRNSSEDQLKLVYERESSNFDTLFGFADGSVALNNFSSEQHFINSYPFVPYQYTLFSEAIKGLSDHNAFEGRHASVGERSLLGVFKDVATSISEKPVGNLAPFDAMYAGISSVLNSFIQSSIQVAEQNLGDDFAVRILKTLFLVKYYTQFKPTLHNITILMLESFDQDVGNLKQRIEEALGLLEQQTYIQKNGELFEFLTKEEKDVETEIKNVELDGSDISSTIYELIFKDILASTKITYSKLGIDYRYAARVDGELKANPAELGINIISPLSDNATGEAAVTMESASADDLFVMLGEDSVFIRDIRLLKKTELYIRQNQRAGADSTRQRIISERGSQNQERRRNLKQRACELLAKATFIARGHLLTIGDSDPKARLQNGFQTLVEKVYINLALLGGHNYTENDVKKFYTDSKEGLFQGMEVPLSEAQQQIIDHVSAQKNQGLRVTLKSIEERFERKNYGWPSVAIAANMAALCGMGKLEARQNSNQLTDERLIAALKGNRDHDSIIFDVQVEYASSQIRGLKNFYSSFFGASPRASDGAGIAREIADEFQGLAGRLQNLSAGAYPFAHKLEDARATFEGLAAKDVAWFMSELATMEDELLANKEDIVDPMIGFLGGQQRQIYDKAKAFIDGNQANFDVAGADLADELRDILGQELCFKGNVMQSAASKQAELEKLVKDALEAKRTEARTKLEEMKARLHVTDEYTAADSDKKAAADAEFESAGGAMEQQTVIPLIDTQLSNFSNQTFPRIISGLAQTSGGTLKEDVIGIRSVYFVPKKTILENESDVDAYGEEMKAALKEQIRNGKRIST